MFRRIEEVLQSIGLDIVKVLKNLTDLPNFFRKLKILKVQKGNDNLFPFGKWYPRLREWKEQGGIASGHYFHQDLFVWPKFIFSKNILIYSKLIMKQLCSKKSSFIYQSYFSC